VVVVGLGLTGFSVVDTLVELGCDVLAVAAQATPERIALTEVIGSSALVTEQGSHRAEAAVNFAPEWAVVSPGVSLDDPVVLALKEAGVPLISDVDLAWRLRDKNHTIAQWVMVSGGGSGRKLPSWLPAFSTLREHQRWSWGRGMGRCSMPCVTPTPMKR